MSKNAYIKLVPASTKSEVSINDLKDLFYNYKQITDKTGEQVGWDFYSASFPYEISEVKGERGLFLYLKSTLSRHNSIVLTVSSEKNITTEVDQAQNYIQVILPANSTHGDKGKAIEFARFIAKQLQGELHLFNGRVMCFYRRR